MSDYRDIVPPQPLTAEERRVLGLMLRGQRNIQIATQLSRLNSVGRSVTAAYHKLGVRLGRELSAAAIRAIGEWAESYGAPPLTDELLVTLTEQYLTARCQPKETE